MRKMLQTPTSLGGGGGERLSVIRELKHLWNVLSYFRYSTRYIWLSNLTILLLNLERIIQYRQTDIDKARRNVHHGLYALNERSLSGWGPKIVLGTQKYTNVVSERGSSGISNKKRLLTMYCSTYYRQTWHSCLFFRVAGKTLFLISSASLMLSR